MYSRVDVGMVQSQKCVGMLVTTLQNLRHFCMVPISRFASGISLVIFYNLAGGSIMCEMTLFHFFLGGFSLTQAFESDSLKSRVEHALKQHVSPALQLDGNVPEVVDVTDGIVRIRLLNVCNGCPSTIMTIIMGMEQELRRHIPEVEYLEAVI